MSIRAKAAIVGFAEIPTLRDYGERSTTGMFAEVAREAIKDAGLRKEDIDGIISSETTNALGIGEALKIPLRYNASMTVHGASGSASVATAAQAIAAGAANCIICIFGGNQPPSALRRRGAGYVYGHGVRGSVGTEFETPYGPAVAMNGHYGLIKQRHMYQYGSKDEHFAKCAVDQRFNAEKNEYAVWKGKPITIEDVLNSRYTNEPLHLLECVMPCSGAHAVIVTSAERARTLPNPPVYVLGTGGPAAKRDILMQDDDITVTPVIYSAPAALQMAEYSVRDIQFAEFYDCYTILVMACLEDAGIAPKGEIGNFYESTDTTYKGTFPINTDGGQISAGQSANSGGGFRHVLEATRQVMKRGGERQVAKSDLCMVNG